MNQKETNLNVNEISVLGLCSTSVEYMYYLMGIKEKKIFDFFSYVRPKTLIVGRH